MTSRERVLLDLARRLTIDPGASVMDGWFRSLGVADVEGGTHDHDVVIDLDAASAPIAPERTAASVHAH